MTRRALAAIGLVGCVLALGGCIRISGTLPASTQPEVVTSTPPVPRPVTHGVVGEKLSSGGWTVTVEDAAREDGKLGGLAPPAGHDFLTVDIGFENKGTEALAVRAQDFELVGPTGDVIPMAKVKKPAFNANSMRPLLPGFGTSTVLVYAVPKGMVRYALVFSPRGAGRKTRLEWQVP